MTRRAVPAGARRARRRHAARAGGRRRRSRRNSTCVVTARRDGQGGRARRAVRDRRSRVRPRRADRRRRKGRRNRGRASALPDTTSRRDWPIVLARPAAPAGWSGPRERQAFARPRTDRNAAIRPTEQMCRSLCSVSPRPCSTATRSRSGTRCSSTTGWPGKRSRTSKAESTPGRRWPRSWPPCGRSVLHGVGQSSWGPTVFAICPTRIRRSRSRPVLRSGFPTSTPSPHRGQEHRGGSVGSSVKRLS